MFLKKSRNLFLLKNDLDKHIKNVQKYLFYLKRYFKKQTKKKALKNRSLVLDMLTRDTQKVILFTCFLARQGRIPMHCNFNKS